MKIETPLIIFLAICSMIGFMVKLPRIFHHYDKPLHAIFYFLAFVILSVLYPKRWILFSFLLFAFGICIEYAQEYSNKFSKRMNGRPIHGRFDIEDVKYNLIGLCVGIFCFLIVRYAFFKKDK